MLKAQNRRRQILLLSVLTASLWLSGCGFHLRGKIDVPENLRSIYIAGDDRELIAEVEKGLRFSSINIADSDEGVAVLDLTNTVYERTINATNSTGQATSYELSYDVNYEMLDPEGKSLQKTRVLETRTFNFDVSQLLAAEREEAFLKADLQKEVASRLLRRLSKIK